MHVTPFEIVLVIIGFIVYGEIKRRGADKIGYQRGAFFTMKEVDQQHRGLIPGRIPDGYTLIPTQELKRLTDGQSPLGTALRLPRPGKR